MNISIQLISACSKSISLRKTVSKPWTLSKIHIHSLNEPETLEERKPTVNIRYIFAIGEANAKDLILLKHRCLSKDFVRIHILVPPASIPVSVDGNCICVTNSLSAGGVALYQCPTIYLDIRTK